MVAPLVKKGDWVEFKMGRHNMACKCISSNPNTVWVEDDLGRIIKLHKKRHFVKVVQKPLEEKGGKPHKSKVDDLINNLSSSS